jgi:GT2 family glycosyltransferase
MDTRAPAVVAVVVTTGSAPGLEATLASLTTQSYEELSLLVLANGEGDNVAARVAAVAPQAFVKILEENRGYAAACNEGALMVEGSAFFLFCHDDVRLESNVVQLMVESAFRTNAGVVTPKMVAYDDAMVLQHVGQTCDRFGVVRERIEPGEIDHGQQDLERDVFVAPGGVTLIRSDLFATLRGFDPLIPVLGEDLDFCWRAQAAGARIVVAPQARVAHRETVAKSERPVTALSTTGVSKQTLQRRHQLLVVATGWGRGRSFTTLLFLFVMDGMELILGVVGGDLERASAIVGSWWWLLGNRRRIFERRARRHEVLVLNDDELSRLQIGGASRLQRFVVVLVREGFDRARGVLPAGPPPLETSDEDALGVGFAAAFATDEEFDEGLEVLAGPSSRPARVLTTFRSQVGVLMLVALLWLVGSRNLITSHLPLVGRLAPLDSWWSTWRHFFASWSPNGVGTGAPGAPGYGLLGFAGTFVFGRMGILPRAALILAVPLGAIGMSRLLKNRVSNRARVVGVIAYLALPTGFNMIAQGRVDVLVVVAGLPFILRRLFDLLALPGFRAVAYRDPVAFGHRGWRVTEAGQRMTLIMGIATMSAFAPATVVIVAIVIVAVTASRWISPDEPNESVHPWRLLGSLLMNVALFLLPMTYDTVIAGTEGFSLFGLVRGPTSLPSWSALLRASDGLFAASWSGWLLPGVALVALLIARRERWALVAKTSTIAVVTLLVCTVTSHHWTGTFAPDIDVLLCLYGAVVAIGAAVAVSAIEQDLQDARFGWRQISAAAAVVALLVASVPFVVATGSGRFDLPTTSVAESLGTLHPGGAGGYRILWLGDPSVLPLPGWSVAPGLAVATTMNGLPGGNELFGPPGAGTSSVLVQDLQLALRGQTVSLGELLAPAGISSIVVLNTPSPQVSGVATAIVRPVTSTLSSALNQQTGLALQLSTSSVSVYTNENYAGLYSEVNPTTGSPAPLFSSSSARGTVYPHWTNVRLGLAPAGAFELDVAGQPTARTVSGWFPTFTVPSSPKNWTANVSLHQFPLNGLLALFTTGLWLIIWLGFGWIHRLEWLFTGRRHGGEGES